MNLPIVLLRIGLSAVFGVAGITKLLDQRGTRDAVKNFGAPESMAPVVGIALPIAELAIAIGLLFVSFTPASSFAAIIILLLFVVAIGVNLAQGRTHDCHCFGQIYSRPIGWPTLIRNLIFALVAGFIFWQGRTQSSPEIAGTLATLTVSEWLLILGVLAAGAAVFVYLNRRHKELPAVVNEPQQGPPIDSDAPAFEIAAYTGGTTSLADLLAHGKPLLLIFTSPKCGPCVALFEEIKDWQKAHSQHLTIALLSVGTIKENFVNVARNGLGQVLLQNSKREVAELYGAKLTPTAVLITESGKIASPLAAGAIEIRKLLSNVLGNSHESPNHNH